MAPLAAQRPTLAAVRLPETARELRLEVGPDIRALEQTAYDPESDTTSVTPLDPATQADRRGLATSVVVRDATGSLYRFSGETGTLGGGRQTLTVPLGDSADTALPFATPLDLIAIELGVTLPADVQATDATFTVHALTATGPDGAGEPVAVPLDLAGGWRLTSSVYGEPHEVVEGPVTGGTLVATAGPAGLSVIRGVDRYGRGTVLTFAPAQLGVIAAAPIPAIASTAFLEASSRSVGDTVPLEIAGVRRTIALVGEVGAFPTVEADVPTLVMDLPTLALVRFEGSDAVDPATEWWLTVPEAGRAATVSALEDRPIDSRAVLTVDGRERALATDPVALGIIGALAIGFVAAALFAVVGFIVSAAVSARERVTEFALLRALGLSSGQLSSWLSLENAVLAGVSLVAGSALGLLIAWVVLPFVTVTQAASTPYPPVEVAVPWLTIAILEAVAIVALTTTVVVLAWLLRRTGLASALRMGED